MEFAEPKINWKEALVERQFGFNGSDTFMHIDGHLEFTPEVAHFLTQIPYIFFNTVNLLIQPFDFDFNGGYISPNNLQFRNHQFLNNFFKIYRGHNHLLSHLKDTILSFICQVRNRKTSNE